MLRWTLGLALIAGFSLCLYGSEQQKLDCAQCGKAVASWNPKYKIVRRTPGGDDGLIVNIVIDKERFNPDDLLALGCALSKGFSGQRSVLVQIFDNKRSAKRYVSRWAQEKQAGWEDDERALRAYFIRQKGKETISWYRDPVHKQGETAVDLCLGNDLATGTLRGVVKDGTGAVLPGATILVEHWEFDRNGRHFVPVLEPLVYSDFQGRFSINLQPGTYDVFVSSPALSPVGKKMKIEAGKETVLDCELPFDPLTKWVE